MAISLSGPSLRARPATTSSKVLSSPSSKVGCGIHVALGGVGDAHGADRAVEGDAREHERGGRRVDRQHVVRVDLVGSDDRPDDVHLVAEAFGERRAQRAVDEPAGQDGLVRALALTAEERAGDLARGVGPLLDVDGQREEVGPLPHRAGRRGGGQKDGVADAGQHGAVGELGELARLEGHGSVGPADRGRNGNGIRHDAPRLSGASSRLVPSGRPPRSSK